MAFITAMLLVDAPASALNNSGEPIPGSRTENTSSVKFIRASDGKTYPYVSAQAVRYWLRNTLETATDIEWQSSPIYREEKVAYTDANPLRYWDDDLFGYMRAPSKGKKKDREADDSFAKMTPMEEDEKGNPRPVTRASPLRVSTLVSIAPVNLTTDFGAMTRQEGDPTPFEHQFYRATLQGLFSVDLGMVGKFYYRRRSGFQNLDKIRRNLAEEMRLEHIESEYAYRLSQDERFKRIRSLLLGFSRLHGGAKQSIHYTDVSPAVVVFALTLGGNHPFNYLFKEVKGIPQFQRDAFIETLTDAHENLLSPVYVGWKPGFLPEERQSVPEVNIDGVIVQYSAPRTAIENLITWLADNPTKWDQ